MSKRQDKVGRRRSRLSFDFCQSFVLAQDGGQDPPILLACSEIRCRSARNVFDPAYPSGSVRNPLSFIVERIETTDFVLVSRI